MSPAASSNIMQCMDVESPLGDGRKDGTDPQCPTCGDHAPSSQIMTWSDGRKDGTDTQCPTWGDHGPSSQVMTRTDGRKDGTDPQCPTCGDHNAMSLVSEAER